MNRTLIRTAAAGLAAVGILGLVACGDDAGSTSAHGRRTAVPATTAAYCRADQQFAAIFDAAPRDPAAFKDFAEKQALPAAKQLADALPTSIKVAGDALVTTMQTIATTGDPSSIDSPAYADATTKIGEQVHSSCGLSKIDVHAMEYHYTGLPSTLDAGKYSVKLENMGGEEHEMVFLRRNDDVTSTFEEIAGLSQDEMTQKVSFAGVAFGKPGTTSYSIVDLKPGTYFVLCTIPVGGAPDGPPHFTKGMEQTVVVG